MAGSHRLLSMLPLQNERLDQISEDCDVVSFVEYYSICFGEDELDLFKSYIEQSTLLSITRALKPNTETLLVGALKHTFAYHRLLMALAGRDDINAWGVPYLMETETDIDASLMLLANRFYKQHLQALRGALENAVTHAFLTAKGVQYDDLPGLRIPPMKDRKRGMLNFLLACGFLNSSQGYTISELYSELSNAMHSRYAYLQNKFEETSEEDTVVSAFSFTRDVVICCMTVMLQMTEMRWT